MSRCDTSARRSVTTGAEGDTCDTSDPGRVVMDPTVPGERRTPANDGRTAHRPKRAKRLSPRRLPGSQPLLDITAPPGESLPGSDVGAVERRARWELAACLHPALEAARSSGLALYSITLTAAEVDTFPGTASRFVDAVPRDDPRAGVLLIRDVGSERGRLHCHGVALVESEGVLVDLWAELAGGSAMPPGITPCTGWRGFCRETYERTFGENLYRVLSYAHKPLPAGRGVRSLDVDYLASGAFAAPLRAFRVRMRAPVLSDAESAVVAPQVSPTRRPCLWCGEPLPAGRKANMKRHPPCRRRASAVKRKREREAAWKAGLLEEAQREADAHGEPAPDD